MFEWWYAFWRWLSEMYASGKMFEPYRSMGFWFAVIIILFILGYIFLLFGMPWTWFRKEKPLT